jgi:hypothetical protein
MKTPTWAIVVGICLILFGGCSVTKSIQATKVPDILAMQQKMMEKMSTDTSTSDSLSNLLDSLGNSLDSLSNSSGRISNSLDSLSSSTFKDAPNPEMFENLAEGMKEMFAMSEFAKTWTVRFGYIGIFVAFLYILSGVFLLLKKEFSIKLVYVALATSIAFGIIESAVLASDTGSGLISKTMGVGNIFGIIIDIILLIVVATADKTAYLENNKIAR